MQTISVRITPFRATIFTAAALLFGVADNLNPQVLPVAILLLIVANLIWHLTEIIRPCREDKTAADAVE